MKVSSVSQHTENPLENEVKKAKGKAEKKAGKRIGYNYIIIKSLKESKKNDVVKCLYIKSLTKFGFCVIKEGTYGDTKDKQGRDIKDRLLWQKKLHELLQDKVRMPKLLGSFEENGNYYLVMEYIKGKPLYAVWRKNNSELRESILAGNKLGIQFLDYLLQIINILEVLHQNNIVHRDASPNNFLITRSGKVAVIDMELSYSLQDTSSPPFLLGTHGFMSTQQEATLTPTVEEDIFAVGAILLQVFTGISASKLNHSLPEELENKIYFLVPDQQMAAIIIQCLHAEVDKRPTLATVKAAVGQYKTDLLKKVKRPSSKPVLADRPEMLGIIQKGIYSLASPLLADPEKGWFAEDRKEPPNPDKSKINKTYVASYNLGVAGVIYLLSKAKSMGMDVEPTLPIVQKGLDLIESKYIKKGMNAAPGLHFGAAGIAASLAAAIESGLIEPTPRHLEWIKSLLAIENKTMGIMHGVAGQGIANLLCSSFDDPLQIDERLHQYTQYLLDKQEKDGSWVLSIKKKKKRVNRGFAHGMAGIVYFLLEYADCYKSAEVLKGAQQGLQWLMREAEHKKDAIDWRSSSGKALLPWWCEGASGIGLAFLKAYSMLQEPAYKKYLTGALNNHPSKVLQSNLSQCHGISGLGEIYLESYRILQEEQWLERAEWIAQALVKIKKRYPKFGPYWIVEHERQPLPGFMTGNSGILHFLLRYCFLNKINFPMMPGVEKLTGINGQHSTLLTIPQPTEV